MNVCERSFSHQKVNSKYKNGVLTIQWDTESFKYEITKPFVGTMNGHPDAEMQAQADEMLNDALEEFKSSAAETDVYNPVVIKKNELIITSRSKDGKKEKETYVRAQ